MARRKRRQRNSPSKANPRSFGELRASAVPQQGQPPSAQTPREQERTDSRPQTASNPSGKKEADWNVEYSRVFSDLKQLLIVSVALFALMLVVGMFL